MKTASRIARLVPIVITAMTSLSVVAPAQAEAAKTELATWDRAANIKQAAERLGVLHRREGTQGVIKFIDACYRTHMLAEAYGQGLEACLAADYMHTRVLAEIYARVPLEERIKNKAPSPELITSTMAVRFGKAYEQYKVPASEADVFKKLVDTHGFPVFVKAIFPKTETGAGTAAAKKGKKE
jgi:hypothetical protein